MIGTLEQILKKENVGKEFIFSSPSLKNHYIHKIISLGADTVGYLSNKNTVVKPDSLKDLDLDVILLERV